MGHGGFSHGCRSRAIEGPSGGSLGRRPALVTHLWGVRSRPTELVHKIIFPMSAGTTPDTLLAAVRDFAENECAPKHRYALALHTDEPHPHLHVVMKAISEEGQRLNIRKATLREWRKAFAGHLRNHGEAEWHLPTDANSPSIPSWSESNTLMGRHIEARIRELPHEGHRAVSDHLARGWAKVPKPPSSIDSMPCSVRPRSD